jgi:hypothetical protein
VELNRLGEAKVVLKKAIANGFDIRRIHAYTLYIAHAQDDPSTQEREAQWLVSHQEQAIVLLEEANTAATVGHLKQAKERFRKGADLARQHPSDTAPQQFLTEAATADALFGKCVPHGTHDPPIVLALCDPAAAKNFNQQQSAKGSVSTSGPEAYVRGLALRSDNQASDSAAVFSQMVDHKAANWGPEYDAAQVGLARAAKAMGDTDPAKKTYEQFFTFWKDADPDIPLLLAARKEYAALK